MIALPVSTVVGEEIAVAFHPYAIKGIANPACKNAVLTGGRVDPQKGRIAFVCFIADVAGRPAVPQQRAVGHDVNRVGLVVSNGNAFNEDARFDVDSTFSDEVGGELAGLRHHGCTVQQDQSVGSVKAVEKHPPFVGLDVQFRDGTAVPVADQQVGVVGPHEARRAA